MAIPLDAIALASSVGQPHAALACLVAKSATPSSGLEAAAGESPFIERAEALYAEAQPLIEQAREAWQTVGPAAQILLYINQNPREPSQP